jgi:DNA-binding response OmpR family regulator
MQSLVRGRCHPGRARFIHHDTLSFGRALAKVAMAKKILVIDDSETVLEATSIVLEDAGYEVIPMSSAALFAVTLNRAKPDLALIDVSMPVVAGQLVVGLARRHQLHPCVIALYSSQPEETLAWIAEDCGADGYVRKTSKPEELLRHVAHLLTLKPRIEAPPASEPVAAPLR